MKKDNNSKKIYTFDSSMDTMVLVLDNELNVLMDSDEESKELNLDTMKFNKSSSLTLYNMVVYTN